MQNRWKIGQTFLFDSTFKTDITPFERKATHCLLDNVYLKNLCVPKTPSFRYVEHAFKSTTTIQTPDTPFNQATFHHAILPVCLHFSRCLPMRARFANVLHNFFIFFDYMAFHFEGVYEIQYIWRR